MPVGLKDRHYLTEGSKTAESSGSGQLMDLRSETALGLNDTCGLNRKLALNLLRSIEHNVIPA